MNTTAMLVATEGLEGLKGGDHELFLERFRNLSGCDLREIMRVLRALMERSDGYRRDCDRLMTRCATLESLITMACCPGNRLYSQATLDGYSDENQVPIVKPVTGLGGDYVDAFPLPPGKKIRLEHIPRPGYEPQKIAIDFSFSGGGDNYLDLLVQFFSLPGGQPNGRTYGPTYRGNQFLNKDGSQIHLNFPAYRGAPHVVGSNEVMQVEITHTGAVNNLNSAFVTLYYDADKYYHACKLPCDPSC